MLKLMGCIVLIACCCMLGYFKASSLRCRCQELENIIELIKLIELEITYKKDPLAKSFNKISSVKPCWFSNVLADCGSKLNGSSSLEFAWERAVNDHRSEAPIKEKDIGVLNDLFMGIGKTDTEGQQKLLEPAIHRMKTNLKDAYLQEQKLGKMYIALGTAAGAVTVILLI